MRSAQSRLEDILGSETRNFIAKHDLIEIVRTDKNRQPLHDKTLKGGPTGTIGVLPPIAFGRLKIEEEIKTAATQKLAGFGIAVLDFRIKRVNYNPDVLDRIYQRMISERLQIAQRFRSEGEGESAPIAGQRERDLNEIQSNAYRQVQQIRGEADAKATEIYARAYTQNPQAAEFYAFLKTLETYHKIFTNDSTLVLSTDSDIFALLKHAATKRAPRYRSRLPQSLCPEFLFHSLKGSARGGGVLNHRSRKRLPDVDHAREVDSYDSAKSGRKCLAQFVICSGVRMRVG